MFYLYKVIIKGTLRRPGKWGILIIGIILAITISGIVSLLFDTIHYSMVKKFEMESEIHNMLTLDFPEEYVDNNNDYTEAIESERNSIIDVQLIMLLILSLASALNIANTVSIGISEKRRYCGTYLALGARPSQVRLALLLETAALTIIILPLGGVLAYGIFHLIFALSGGFTFFQVHIYPISALKVLAASLVTILTASIVPANKAMSIPPIEAAKTDTFHYRYLSRRRYKEGNQGFISQLAMTISTGVWLEYKSIRRFKARIICSIAAISAVMAVSVAVSYYIGLEIKKSDALGDPDFSIFSAAEYPGVRVNIDNMLVTEYLSLIREFPEIETLSLEAYYSGKLSAGAGGQEIYGQALYDNVLSTYYPYILDGSLQDVIDGKGIAVASNQYAVGDILNISFNERTGLANNEISLKVSAILGNGYNADPNQKDGIPTILSMGLFENIIKGSIYAIRMTVYEGTNLLLFGQRLEEAIGERKLRCFVHNTQEIRASNFDERKNVRIIKQTFDGISILFMLLVIINIINHNHSSAKSRASEFGIMKAVGANKGTAAIQVMTEIIFTNITACILGVLFTQMLIKIIHQTSNIYPWNIPLEIPSVHILFVAGMISIFNLISALIITQNVLRLNVTDALRAL